MTNQQRRDKQIVSALLVWCCPEKMSVFCCRAQHKEKIDRVMVFSVLDL